MCHVRGAHGPGAAVYDVDGSPFEWDQPLDREGEPLVHLADVEIGGDDPPDLANDVRLNAGQPLNQVQPPVFWQVQPVVFWQVQPVVFWQVQPAVFWSPVSDWSPQILATPLAVHRRRSVRAMNRRCSAPEPVPSGIRAITPIVES